jgi:hypothetical protein
MKNLNILIFTTIAAALLTGCGKPEQDCTNPKNQQEQDQCAAHKEATNPRGPGALPAAPKKW